MSVDGEAHHLQLRIHNGSDGSDKPQPLRILDLACMTGAPMRSASDHTQIPLDEYSKIVIAPGSTQELYVSGVDAQQIGGYPFTVPGAMRLRGTLTIVAEKEGLS